MTDPDTHYAFTAKLFEVTAEQVAVDVQNWKELAKKRHDLTYLPDENRVEIHKRGT